MKPLHIHHGQAEQAVVQKFIKAAEIYAQSPAVLTRLAMNIIYETTRERGAIVLMPSAMVDARNPEGSSRLLDLLAKPTVVLRRIQPSKQTSHRPT